MARVCGCRGCLIFEGTCGICGAGKELRYSLFVSLKFSIKCREHSIWIRISKCNCLNKFFFGICLTIPGAICYENNIINGCSAIFVKLS